METNPTNIYNFRVAPAVTTRQCQSASKAVPESPCSSPDPLEPWCVRKVANMNTILAWENDQDSI